MIQRLLTLALVTLFTSSLAPRADAQDVVLRASDFTSIHGSWTINPDDSAADSHYLGSSDNGTSSTAAPPAQPADYIEAAFDAPAGVQFHVWFRLRASGNSKYNDSVWVQYSDAVNSDGQAVYALGGATALAVNLARCSTCGLSGWGWQDGAYWLSQATTIRFASSGTHRLRLQVREDGVQIDQVVLSRTQYLYQSPGTMTDDAAVVPRAGGGGTPAAAATAEAASGGAGPYLGSPVALPGHVKAENFDNGGDGVSYHDTTSGNAGGQFRQTGVDIEPCSSGGYDIGWTQSGEWLNYAVTAAGGSYTVQLRVASVSGASMHVGFNGPSNVWKTVNVPATGGWQAWTTVRVPVTLGAGNQTMTLLFDTPGANLDYIDVVPGTTSGGTVATPTTPTPPTPTGGSTITVVNWNVQVNDSSSSHATGAIDYVMAMTPQPQVVVLQEVRQSLYGRYLSELQARSGRSWQGVFQTHCPPGAFNGSSCTGTEDEGVAVFSSLPVVDSGGTLLPAPDQYHSARGVARLAVSAGGVITQVFSVHMPLTAAQRATSMSDFKGYASRYSVPQLVAGDFNADQDQIDPGMSPAFVDSWTQVGSGRGFTAFTPSPSMKLDYWLQDAGGRARPAWSVVVTTPGTFSDHYPVINSYSIR